MEKQRKNPFDGRRCVGHRTAQLLCRVLIMYGFFGGQVVLSNATRMDTPLTPHFARIHVGLRLRKLACFAKFPKTEWN